MLINVLGVWNLATTMSPLPNVPETAVPVALSRSRLMVLVIPEPVQLTAPPLPPPPPPPPGVPGTTAVSGLAGMRFVHEEPLQAFTW